MKVKKKNVYYCDFCKKHSLSPSLKIHENHCTANPDRECRLCERESVREIIDKYRKYFTVHPMNEAIKIIKEFTLEDIEGELEYQCPNCIFTIIRCLGLNRYYFERKFKFDYKKELAEWWAMENERLQEEAERETYY